MGKYVEKILELRKSGKTYKESIISRPESLNLIDERGTKSEDGRRFALLELCLGTGLSIFTNRFFVFLSFITVVAFHGFLMIVILSGKPAMVFAGCFGIGTATTTIPFTVIFFF